MTRRYAWIALGVIVAAAAIYYPFSDAGRQAGNVRKAERHIESLAPQIAADARFSSVELSTGTHQEGCLVIDATRIRPTDADDLQTMVTASAPPVEVHFRLPAAAP